jgi:hypothetical protein
MGVKTLSIDDKPTNHVDRRMPSYFTTQVHDLPKNESSWCFEGEAIFPTEPLHLQSAQAELCYHELGDSLVSSIADLCNSHYPKVLEACSAFANLVIRW